MRDGRVLPDLTPLTLADVPAAAALSASFGWPHRTEDWALMLRMGCGLKLATQDGLQGTIMWWTQGNQMATFGMVMVPDALQGQGIGTHLMQAAIEANAGKTLALNATPEGMTLYQRSGFRAVGITCQNQGIASGAGDAGGAVTLAGRYVGPQIIALDQAVTGLMRAPILQSLIMVSDLAVVMDPQSGLIGYALSRVFGKGRVIGPVVAPDAQTAKALITFFLHRYAGQFLRIDTPDTHGLSPWLAAQGLIEVAPATSMRVGPDQDGVVFALASQALG